jgi:hypothetical protein
MPTGFDQQPFQYAQPAPVPTQGPPTPSRNQNTGGFQDVGQWPNTPQPTQLPPRAPPTPSRPQNAGGFQDFGQQSNTPRPTQPSPRAPPTPSRPQNAVGFQDVGQRPTTPLPNQQPPNPGLPGPSSRSNVTEYDGEYFQTLAQVKTYCQELVWWPSMGPYGLPRTTQEKKHYMDVLKAALSSTADIWDKDSAPADFHKFVSGDPWSSGEWTGPKDVEAAAIIVLSQAVKIHVQGVVGLPFRRSNDYMAWNVEDMDFTFAQRIHFVAWLLEHSKVAAANVMAVQCVDKFVALPFTMLKAFPNFEQEWMSLSAEDKQHFKEVIPYERIEFKHPTEEQQKVLRERSQAVFQDAKAREAGFPDAKTKSEYEAAKVREDSASRAQFGDQSPAPAGSPIRQGQGDSGNNNQISPTTQRTSTGTSTGQGQGRPAPGLAFGNNQSSPPTQRTNTGQDQRQGQGQGQGQMMGSNSGSFAALDSLARPRNASSPTGRVVQQLGGAPVALKRPSNQPQQYSGGGSSALRRPSNQPQQYAEGPPMFQEQLSQFGNFGGRDPDANAEGGDNEL